MFSDDISEMGIKNQKICISSGDILHGYIMVMIFCIRPHILYLLNCGSFGRKPGRGGNKNKNKIGKNFSDDKLN